MIILIHLIVIKNQDTGNATQIQNMKIMKPITPVLNQEMNTNAMTSKTAIVRMKMIFLEEFIAGFTEKK